MGFRDIDSEGEEDNGAYSKAQSIVPNAPSLRPEAPPARTKVFIKWREKDSMLGRGLTTPKTKIKHLLELSTKELINPVSFWTADTKHRLGEKNVHCDPTPARTTPELALLRTSSSRQLEDFEPRRASAPLHDGSLVVLGLKFTKRRPRIRYYHH
ncbi:hypothetical protein TNCV_3483961 [Trichonephila clavipes]|nr:hypothetical protein TNCV_3483961 [Trichonephila clavipes]